MSQQTVPQLRFVDRPEVSETFADSIHGVAFDGQTMRIDCCVTRLDSSQPSEAPTARQVPSCRLVLTPSAGIDLFNRLQQILKALEKSGAIQRTSPPSPTVQ